MAEFRAENVGKVNLAAAQAFKTQQDRIKAEQGLCSASDAETASATPNRAGRKNAKAATNMGEKYDVDFVQFKEYRKKVGEGRHEDVGYNFFNDFMLCLDAVEVGYLKLALVEHLLFGSRKVGQMGEAVGGFIDRFYRCVLLLF